MSQDICTSYSFCHGTLCPPLFTQVSAPMPPLQQGLSQHPIQNSIFPPSPRSPSRTIPVLFSWWYLLLSEIILFTCMFQTIIHLNRRYNHDSHAHIKMNIYQSFFNSIINEVTTVRCYNQFNREVQMPCTDIQLRNAETDLQTDVKLTKLLNIDKGINQLHCTWHSLQFYGQELIAWLTVFYNFYLYRVV